MGPTSKLPSRLITRNPPPTIAAPDIPMSRGPNRSTIDPMTGPEYPALEPREGDHEGAASGRPTVLVE